MPGTAAAGAVGAREVLPRRSVDARRVEGLRRREVGEDSGQAFGEHRLSAPGRSHEEHRVASRRRDLEGAARDRLPDHVREVRSAFGSGGAASIVGVHGPGVGAGGGRFLAREGGRRLAKGTDGDHPDPGHQASLVPVVEGSDDPRELGDRARGSTGRGPRGSDVPCRRGKVPRRSPTRPAPLPGRTPSADSTDSAIGRSRREPSFRRSAGARLTVTFRPGKGSPELRTAARIRSSLSRTAPPGSPTTV